MLAVYTQEMMEHENDGLLSITIEAPGKAICKWKPDQTDKQDVEPDWMELYWDTTNWDNE